MSLSVDLLSILLFATLAQGIFILSVLAIKYRFKSREHIYLFLMVLGLVWLQAEFLSVRLDYDVRINWFYGTRYGVWFVLGPLYYGYVGSIANEESTFSPVTLWHFAPFLIFVFVIPLLATDFLSFRQVNYGMLSTFDPFNDEITIFQYIYSSVFIAQFIHLLIYLSVAVSKTIRYEKGLKRNYSNINVTNIRWLKTMNIFLLVVMVFAVSFLILFFVTRSYNRSLDYLYVLPMALTVYLVGYRLAGVQWLSPQAEGIKTSKYEKSTLRPDQAKAYVFQLEEYMAKSRPFLENELRLQDLAERMSIQVHHLSQVLNEHIGTNFFDYVNRFRVEEARNLIASDPDSSLLEIAFKAGFNNKTSFNHAFKKFTTQTAGEYRKNNRRSKK